MIFYSKNNYIADKCIDVICKDCIKDPERKTEYKGEKQ